MQFFVFFIFSNKNKSAILSVKYSHAGSLDLVPVNAGSSLGRSLREAFPSCQLTPPLGLPRCPHSQCQLLFLKEQESSIEKVEQV